MGYIYELHLLIYADYLQQVLALECGAELVESTTVLGNALQPVVLGRGLREGPDYAPLLEHVGISWDYRGAHVDLECGQ